MGWRLISWWRACPSERMRARLISRPCRAIWRLAVSLWIASWPHLRADRLTLRELNLKRRLAQSRVHNLPAPHALTSHKSPRNFPFRAKELRMACHGSQRYPERTRLLHSDSTKRHKLHSNTRRESHGTKTHASDVSTQARKTQNT